VRLLVVGASGHLGGVIARRAEPAGWSVVGTYHRATTNHAAIRLDVRDPVAVSTVVAELAPDAVVNCAYAYDSWPVTADGAGHVAAAARAVGARLVHVSSDVVHSGRPLPYADDDAPSPVHAYGAAKAAAETAVRVADPTAVLVRTSLLVGDADSAAVKLCLDLLTGARDGALFTDEIRCPVAVEDVADALLELAGRPYAGLLNLAGPQAVSRAEFGRLVAAAYGLDPAALKVSTIAESGLARPGRVQLDCDRAASLLRARPRPVAAVLLGR
jgi:dTDP-4-dehydrorhamnose reductase